MGGIGTIPRGSRSEGSIGSGRTIASRSGDDSSSREEQGQRSFGSEKGTRVRFCEGMEPDCSQEEMGSVSLSLPESKRDDPNATCRTDARRKRVSKAREREKRTTRRDGNRFRKEREGPWIGTRRFGCGPSMHGINVDGTERDEGSTEGSASFWTSSVFLRFFHCVSPGCEPKRTVEIDSYFHRNTRCERFGVFAP